MFYNWTGYDVFSVSAVKLMGWTPKQNHSNCGQSLGIYRYTCICVYSYTVNSEKFQWVRWASRWQWEIQTTPSTHTPSILHNPYGKKTTKQNELLESQKNPCIRKQTCHIHHWFLGEVEFRYTCPLMRWVRPIQVTQHLERNKVRLIPTIPTNRRDKLSPPPGLTQVALQWMMMWEEHYHSEN